MQHPAWYYEVFSHLFSHRRDYAAEVARIDAAAPLRGLRVQEIGAGTGEHSAELLRRGPGHLELVDWDDEAVRRLRERFGGSANVSVVHADGFEQGGAFDVVVAMQSVVQLAPSRDAFSARLRTLTQRLASGGSLFMELIDAERSRAIYPHALANEIYRDGEDWLRIWTEYGAEVMTIHYAGRIGSAEIRYEAHLLPLRREEMERIGSVEALDDDGRRLLVHVRRD